VHSTTLGFGSFLLFTASACSPDLSPDRDWMASTASAPFDGAAGSAGMQERETEARAGAGGRPLRDGPALEPTVVGGADCPEASLLTPDLEVSGKIHDEDVVWRGVVHVVGDVEAYDASITIEPGTVILVDRGLDILMGGLGEVLLSASGTLEQPIRFCGSGVGAGYWVGLTLNNMSPASTLEHVLIDGAGSVERALGVGAPIVLRSLRIRNSGSEGLHVFTFGDGSDDLSIEGSAGYPIVFTGPSAITRFPVHATFIDNAEERAVVRFESLGDFELTYHDIGVPYLQEGDFSVGGTGSAKLTFEAGVQYLIAKGRRLVATADPMAESELQILGSPDAPVLIAGSEPVKGHWKDFVVGSQVSETSTISHLVISDAGAEGVPAFTLRRSIALQGVTLTNSQTGAYFAVAPLAGSANVSSTGNDGYPLTIEPQVLTALPAGGAYVGNEIDMVRVNQGELPAGSVRKLGVPYRLERAILTAETTFEAGSEFVVAAAGKVMTTGGSMLVQGTALEPVVFRGEQDSRGSWEGIRVQDSGSSFNFMKVLNAGLQLDFPTSVTNCSFSGSASFGITKRAADMTDYMSTNIFANNAMGNIGM
jgi:hypothetical protein